jgi:hypothetical protein
MIKKTLIKYLEVLKTEVLRYPNLKIITGGAQVQEIKCKKRLDALYDDLTTILSQIKSLV